jgi:hypothetical protein
MWILVTLIVLVAVRNFAATVAARVLQRDRVVGKHPRGIDSLDRACNYRLRPHTCTGTDRFRPSNPDNSPATSPPTRTLGLRVIMVADANAARRDEDHNATLHTIYRTFGDVRPTSDVLTMIEANLPS